MNTEDDVLAPHFLLRLYMVLSDLQGSHPDPERGRVLERIRPLRNRIAHSVGSRDGIMREFDQLLPDIAGYLALIESSSLGSAHARLARSAPSAGEISDVLLRVTEREEVRLHGAPVQAVPPGTSVVRQAENLLGEAAGPLVCQAREGDRSALEQLRGIIDRMTRAYCRVRIGERDGSYDFADRVARSAAAGALRNLIDVGTDRSLIDVVLRLSDSAIATLFFGAVDPIPDVASKRYEYLQMLFGKLSDGQRDVLLLRVALGLPIKKIAKILGITTGAVRASHYRALRLLRSELALEVAPGASHARAEEAGSPHVSSGGGLTDTRFGPGERGQAISTFVGVDAGYEDRWKAEKIALELHDTLLATARTVVVHEVDGHYAMSFKLPTPLSDTTVNMLAGQGFAVAVRGASSGRVVGPETLRAGASAAAEAHQYRREGHALRFQGQQSLRGRHGVADILTFTAIEAVSPRGIVDMRGNLTPFFRNGKLVLVIE